MCEEKVKELGLGRRRDNCTSEEGGYNQRIKGQTWEINGANLNEESLIG
jgi:hypothetical protein